MRIPEIKINCIIYDSEFPIFKNYAFFDFMPRMMQHLNKIDAMKNPPAYQLLIESLIVNLKAACHVTKQ